MRKIVVIFLLLQIVTNNIFAEELIRMPRLFTHYFHHSNEHKDTKDFFDFLHKHYSDHHEKDTHSKKHSDEDNDCQLPFKHCGGCCLNVHSSVIGFVPTILSADYTFPQIKNTGFMAQDDRIESLDICNIWQPPKIS
ncbi:MAG: hypothetical protein ACK46W_01730 [Bacteroidota bacterium]